MSGEAALAERALAEELFAEIEDLEALRARLAHLAEVQETPPPCPPDWGALRLTPSAIELWEEAPDRIHERRLFERVGSSWRSKLLAP